MSRRIPKGWEFWSIGGASEEIAWFGAVHMKENRETVRLDLFVRVKVVKGPSGSWWILRKEETRQKETGT